MKTIFTHPDHLQLIQRKADKGEFSTQNSDPFESLFGIKIVTNLLMEKMKPSGKYILPDGRVVTKQDVVVKCRFVTYGPEDVEWLLMAGIIKNEMTANFYIMDDSSFRIQYMAKYGISWPKTPSLLLASSF